MNVIDRAATLRDLPSGEDFRSVRELASCSQEQAAAMCGVSRTSLQNYEYGGAVSIPVVAASYARVYKAFLRQVA